MTSGGESRLLRAIQVLDELCLKFRHLRTGPIFSMEALCENYERTVKESALFDMATKGWIPPEREAIYLKDARQYAGLMVDIILSATIDELAQRLVPGKGYWCGYTRVEPGRRRGRERMVYVVDIYRKNARKPERVVVETEEGLQELLEKLTREGYWYASRCSPSGLPLTLTNPETGETVNLVEEAWRYRAHVISKVVDVFPELYETVKKFL